MTVSYLISGTDWAESMSHFCKRPLSVSPGPVVGSITQQQGNINTYIHTHPPPPISLFKAYYLW